MFLSALKPKAHAHTYKRNTHKANIQRTYQLQTYKTNAQTHPCNRTLTMYISNRKHTTHKFKPHTYKLKRKHANASIQTQACKRKHTTAYPNPILATTYMQLHTYNACFQTYTHTIMLHLKYAHNKR